MLQIYHGDGKGKTTAAVGLSVRAAGKGKKVYFAQFLKNDSSGEIEALRGISNIKILHSDAFFGFIRNMTEEQKLTLAKSYKKMFDEVLSYVYDRDKADNTENNPGRNTDNNVNSSHDIYILLIFDELLHVCNERLLDYAYVVEKLSKLPPFCEVVITGRNPTKEIIDIADYVTNFVKEKHPFDKGITAREGIEF